MAKVSRKDLLKKPDEFITFSDRAVRWAQENRQKVIVGASAVVLLIAVFLGGRSYLNYRRAAAAQALGAAFGAYQAALQDKAKAPGAIARLRRVANDYGGTASGHQARLALAGLLMLNGQAAEAQKVYQALWDEGELAPEMRPLVGRGLGQCLEVQKKYRQAARAYYSAAQKAGPSLKAALELDQARALEAAGDKKAAGAIYRRLALGSQDQAAQSARRRLVALDQEPPQPRQPVRPLKK